MTWKVKWRDSARKELRKLDGAAVPTKFIPSDSHMIYQA